MMKKRFLAIVLTMAMAFMLTGGITAQAQAPFEPFGTTRDSVIPGVTYTISTEDELAYFAQFVNTINVCTGVTIELLNSIVITADHSADGGNWTPIGTSANKFEGTFEGCGYYISGLQIYQDINSGLFGDNRGTIKNVGVYGNIGGTSYVGGIVGINESSGVIEHCYNFATMVCASNGHFNGGIAGYNDGIIRNCYNGNTVSAFSTVGGIAGINAYGLIENCFNAGAVYATSYVGGIVGANTHGDVYNCYSSGRVAGTTAVGSVIGSNLSTMDYCYWLNTSTQSLLGEGAPPASGTSFTSAGGGTLSTMVEGRTSLLDVLNGWISAQASPSNYLTWVAPSSGAYTWTYPYPIFTGGIVPYINITTQPQNALMITGNTATFTIAAASAPDPTFFYRWQVSTDNGANWNTVTDGTSANAPSYTTVATTLAMSSWQYRCIIFGSSGSVASNAATLTVVPPITGLPATYSMYTGGSVTWQPNPSGGTWEYDNTFFSATFNSPATFTALKVGTSSITYKVNGQAQSITVTISANRLPYTGIGYTLAYTFAGLSVAAAAAGLIVGRRKSRNDI